jgi:transposase-like protein
MTEGERDRHRTRPAYSPALRQKIVELTRAGGNAASLARELKPTENTIRNWVAQADRNATEAFGFMKTQEDRHTITTVTRVLWTSRSGYFAWVNRRPCRRSEEDSELSRRTRAIHEQSRGTYGVPRIHTELCDSGIHVGRKRVARLMREKGLRGVSRRKGSAKSVGDKVALVATYLVKGEFRAQRPNQLWVADITSVPTRAGFFRWRWCWTPGVIGWSDAPSPLTCVWSGCWPLWRWPSLVATLEPLSTIPIRAANTPLWRSASAVGRPASARR